MASKDTFVKRLFLACAIPLVLFAVGYNTYYSVKYELVNAAGLVILLYYSVPVFLYTLSLNAIVHILGTWLKRPISFLEMIFVSIALAVFVVGLWFVLFDGSRMKISDPHGYWAAIVSHFLWIVLYFAVAIPVVDRIVVRREKRKSQA